MAESEALETQSWLEDVVECGYTEKNVAAELFKMTQYPNAQYLQFPDSSSS